MHLAQRLKKDGGLAVILLLYLTLATAHSLIVPLTTGNDEWAHFLYVRFIHENGRLPITLEERQNRAEVGTKSDDPPLYHLLVATLAAPVESIRVLRPVDGDPWRQLADNLVVSYAFIVHTGYELLPHQGEVLVWFVGRAVSILTGATLILLTYFTALNLFPQQKTLALSAAALLAFIPAFIFHTSVMTYDGLGAVFTGMLLLVAIRTIRQPARWQGWLILGGLSGLAVTTKYTSVLIPLEILFIGGLAYYNSQRHNPLALRAIVSRVAVALVVLFFTTLWWFGFVIVNFNTIAEKGLVVGTMEPLLVRGGNDSTAISLTANLLGEQNVSVDLPAPSRERDYPALAQTLLDSFWSARVNEQYLLSPWLSWLFSGLGLLAACGLVYLWQRVNSWHRTWLLLLLFHTLLITPLIILRLLFSFDPVEAVQGRHILFPAATAIPILLVWGWQQWWSRLSSWVVVALLLWSLLGQLGSAALIYPGPLPIWSAKQPPNILAAPVKTAILPELQLTNASWKLSPTQQTLQVTLWWHIAKRLPDDYLIELTLRNPSNQLIGAAIGHPVQGRYPTRAWEADDIVRDDYTLPLLSSSGKAALYLRLLNREGMVQTDTMELGQVEIANIGQTASCTVWLVGHPPQNNLFMPPLRQRQSFAVISAEPPHLEPLSEEGQLQSPFKSFDNLHWFVVNPDWPDSYQLWAGDTACGVLRFELPERNFTPDSIPHPLTANFDNKIQLLGYDLPTRRIEPGQRLPVTFYWHSLAYMNEDYRLSANPLDEHQQRWGGYDRRPRDGYSTLLWVPGEIITDPFGIPIDPNAPDGIYTIDFGFYRETESGLETLPLVEDGNILDHSSIRLGPIKVGGPPAGVTVISPEPDNIVEQSFGEQITLLGYDLQFKSEQLPTGETSGTSTPSLSPTSISLKFYWSAEMIPTADYTVFLHLRDASGQNVAQKDRPPADGRYPTSLWDAGEIIADEIILPIDHLPPGRYTLVVGLYDFATGNRLPTVNDPTNEIALKEIEIGD